MWGRPPVYDEDDDDAEEGGECDPRYRDDSPAMAQNCPPAYSDDYDDDSPDGGGGTLLDDPPMPPDDAPQQPAPEREGKKAKKSKKAKKEKRAKGSTKPPVVPGHVPTPPPQLPDDASYHSGHGDALGEAEEEGEDLDAEIMAVMARAESPAPQQPAPDAGPRRSCASRRLSRCSGALSKKKKALRKKKRRQSGEEAGAAEEQTQLVKVFVAQEGATKVLAVPIPCKRADVIERVHERFPDVLPRDLFFYLDGALVHITDKTLELFMQLNPQPKIMLH